MNQEQKYILLVWGMIWIYIMVLFIIDEKYYEIGNMNISLIFGMIFGRYLRNG